MESGILPGFEPISSNMISTDLFTPTQMDRITIPTIGVQPVKLKNQTWYEDIRHYGGIGALPFRGEIRVKDLYVPRSHRHFGSGFSRYKTKVQRSQITSLMKGGCRLNDQVLPKPFDTPLDMTLDINISGEYVPCVSMASDDELYGHSDAIKLKDAPTEGRPYTSHEPKFEVFPRKDPNRTDAEGNSPLTEATRNALNEINRDLYQTSKYQQTYQDHTDYLRELQEKRLAKQIQSAKARNNLIKEKYPKMDEACDESQDEKDEDDNAGDGSDEDRPVLKSILIKKNFCPVHDATPPKDDTPKAEKAGVNPCWPPSLSYTIDLRTAKLNEIDLPKSPPALRSSLSPKCCCSSLRPKKSVSFSTVIAIDTPMPASSSRIVRPPTPFKDSSRGDDSEKAESNKSNAGKLCKGTCLVSTDGKTNETCLANTCLNISTGRLDLPVMTDHPAQPALKPPTRLQVKELNGVQLPVPIDYYGSMTIECGPGPTFSAPCPKPELPERIVDKLGVGFKSEAHKRFHARHPDPPKDLRDARKDGKRCFFFGVHASAFRG